jgi:hypothetical protein
VAVVTVALRRAVHLVSVGRRDIGKENQTVKCLPSYPEYTGLYNVAPEDFSADANFAGAARTTFFVSTDHLPKLTWDEFDGARAAMMEALSRYGRRPNMDAKQSQSYYRDCVIDEFKDRTLRVELPDFRVLTPEFVDGVQRDVLAGRPLWRVFLVAVSPETVVLIYPDAVRVGALPADADWRAALSGVVATVHNALESTRGPERRQMEYLLRRMPAELDQLRQQPFRLVAVFDNYEGDERELSLWFLFAGEDRWAGYSLNSDDPDATSATGRVVLKPDGTIDEFYEIQLDAEPPFWLERWLVHADYRRGLELVKIRTGGVEAGRWRVAIDRAQVLRDADLAGAAEAGPR